MAVVSAHTCLGFIERGKVIVTNIPKQITIYKEANIYTFEGTYKNEGMLLIEMTGFDIEMPPTYQCLKDFSFSDGTLIFKLWEIKHVKDYTYNFYWHYEKVNYRKSRPQYEQYNMKYQDKVLFIIQFLNKQKNLKRRRIDENQLMAFGTHAKFSDIIIRKPKNYGINNAEYDYFTTLPNDVIYVIIGFLLDNDVRENIKNLRLTGKFWANKLYFNPMIDFCCSVIAKESVKTISIKQNRKTDYFGTATVSDQKAYFMFKSKKIITTYADYFTIYYDNSVNFKVLLKPKYRLKIVKSCIHIIPIPIEICYDAKSIKLI